MFSDEQQSEEEQREHSYKERKDVDMSTVRSYAEKVKHFTGKVLFVVITLAIVVAFGVVIFYIGWVTSVEKHEVCFTFDRWDNGKIEVLDYTGYVIRMPIRYAVHTIDLRPYQIPITSSFGSEGVSSIPSRVLNAKLVQFNPNGLLTFIAWHGRQAGDDLANLKEIMKCYAFDKENGKNCPFITVLDELSPSQTPAPSGSSDKNSNNEGS